MSTKKYYTATCTIIKDEQQYLDEWIRHNLDLGFDEIWLYEDYGSISHKEITDKYPQVVLQSISEIEDVIGSFKAWQKQLQTWKYFTSNDELRSKFDYVAFIDIDEFIMFDEGYDLQTLLNEYNEHPAILLYWKYYGANGNVMNPKTDVVTTYTKQSHYLRAEFRYELKSLVNMKYDGDIEWLTNHEVKDGVCTNDKIGHLTPSYEKAWINHYYTRSWEEWCDRFIKRGDINPGCRKFNEFFRFNKDMIKDSGKLMQLRDQFFKNFQAKKNAEEAAVEQGTNDENQTSEQQ